MCITDVRKSEVRVMAYICARRNWTRELSDLLSHTGHFEGKRRLSTIIASRKLANTVSHARQLVVHKKVLIDARTAIEKGAPFSAVFVDNPKLYPVMMSEMIQVGEETGKLSDMLLQIAVFYEDEIENKTKNLSTIIEPVLMIVIGAVVGFFAVSMIQPMYSMLGAIE